MTQISLVAKNYAKALFGAAKDNNNIDKIAKEFDIFKKSFGTNFVNELQNPAISKADSIKIITEISKKLNIDKLLLNFLTNLSKNRRLGLFTQVYAEFIRLLKIEKNILEIELISNSTLEKSVIDSIKNIINKQHPNKSIEVRQTSKSEILGGLQIKIGSNLIDASLRNKLALIQSRDNV